MKLIEKIKKHQLASRKLHCSLLTALLTTLIGEAEMVGKNANREVTDDEVIAVIKKFIKNIDLTLSVIKDVTIKDITDKAKCLAEKQTLESFLPKQLNEEQLREIIDYAIDVYEAKTIPLLMKYLKDNYAGKYDGKMAADLCKEIL